MKKLFKILFSVAVLATMMFAMSVAVMAATPAKVTGIQQTDAGSNSVSIQWEAVLGQNIYYEVSMSTDNVNWVIVDEDRYTNTYYAYDLTAGRTYYFKVRAYEYSYSNGNTYGVVSDVFAAVTEPSGDTNIKQTGATTSSVTVSWSVVSGATAYEVYKEMNNTEYLVGTTTGTSYTLTGFSNTIDFPAEVYVVPVRKAGTYAAKPSYVDSIYSFNIKLVPAKVQNVHVSYYYESLKQVELDYNAAEYADGYAYELYNHKGKKITSGTTSSSYGFSLKNIAQNRFYKVRVRAYVTVNNKTIYGAWSDYQMFGHQPKVNLKQSGRTLKLSWKKVQGAKSYTVYMSTKQKSGYKKIKTLKKTSLKVTKFKKKKLNKKKTYYVYVVANTKLGKKTFKTNAEKCYYLIRY